MHVANKLQHLRQQDQLQLKQRANPKLGNTNQLLTELRESVAARSSVFPVV